MAPVAQIILLGGSNVARGLSTIVEIARRTVTGPAAGPGAGTGAEPDAAAAGNPCGPAEFLIAAGHGRSYGKRSTVLGRSLPGITECGLWDALARDGRPTFALITDIGNDVAYGAPVPAIGGWIDACARRLAEAGARTVMTPLPLASLRQLTPWRFMVARSLLFPANRFTLAEALERSRELDERVRDVAGSHGVRLAEQEGSWYGVDPIHIRQRYLVAAWTRIMSAWRDDGAAAPAVRRSLARWLRLRRLTPQRWWLLGRPRGRPQPAGKLADGTTISLF